MDIHLATKDLEIQQCAKLMFQSEPWKTFNFNFGNCMIAIQGEYKEVYIVKINDTFVGFVVIQLYGVLRGYIQTICIKPEFRNRGIGTSLLKFCEKRIFKISPNMFLCVSSFNDKAQNLYYRLGFEKIGELKNHIIQGSDEFILRKTSGPTSEFIPAR